MNAGEQIQMLLMAVNRHRQQGDYERCQTLLRQAQLLIPENDRSLKARLLATEGQLHRDQGAWPESEDCYQQAADLYTEVRSPMGTAHAIRHIADVAFERGNHDKAYAHYQKAITIYRTDHRTTSSLHLANALRGFAILKETLQQYDEAFELWQEANSLYETAGVDEGVEECQTHLHQLRS